jgi:hypothetical protein
MLANSSGRNHPLQPELRKCCNICEQEDINDAFMAASRASSSKWVRLSSSPPSSTIGWICSSRRQYHSVADLGRSPHSADYPLKALKVFIGVTARYAGSNQVCLEQQPRVPLVPWFFDILGTEILSKNDLKTIVSAFRLVQSCGNGKTGKLSERAASGHIGVGHVKGGPPNGKGRTLPICATGTRIATRTNANRCRDPESWITAKGSRFLAVMLPAAHGKRRYWRQSTGIWDVQRQRFPFVVLSAQQWFLETTACGSWVTVYTSPAPDPSTTGDMRPASRRWRRQESSRLFSMMDATGNSLPDAGLLMHHHTAVDIGQHVTRRHGKTEIAELTQQHEMKAWLLGDPTRHSRAT